MTDNPPCISLSVRNSLQDLCAVKWDLLHGNHMRSDVELGSNVR